MDILYIVIALTIQTKIYLRQNMTRICFWLHVTVRNLNPLLVGVLHYVW